MRFPTNKGGGAKVYVGLGDVEKAFSWLNEAVDSLEYDTFSTRWWNFEYDPIRDDPRFHDLLRRMNLEP